jgi:hypothetical protein
MEPKDELLAFALMAAMGLVVRGASPDEVRDMSWVYAKFAMEGKPSESNSNSN